MNASLSASVAVQPAAIVVLFTTTRLTPFLRMDALAETTKKSEERMITKTPSSTDWGPIMNKQPHLLLGTMSVASSTESTETEPLMKSPPTCLAC